MSQITLNSFRNLFGKVNDGQFIISGDGDQAGLERVNRGSNFFSKHFWYPQKDLSNSGQDNLRTRDALYKLLCADNGLDAENLNDDAVKQFRRKLGLDDNNVKYTPLQCRDVKGIVEQYTSSAVFKDVHLNAIRDEYVEDLRNEEFKRLSETDQVVFPEDPKIPLPKELFDAHVATLKARIDLIFNRGMEFPIDKSGEKTFESVNPDFEKKLREKYAWEFDQIEKKVKDLNENVEYVEFTRHDQEYLLRGLNDLIRDLVFDFETAHAKAEVEEYKRVSDEEWNTMIANQKARDEEIEARNKEIEEAQNKAMKENKEAFHRGREELISLQNICNEIAMPKDAPLPKADFEALVKRLEDTVEEVFTKGMDCPADLKATPFKSFQPDFANQLRQKYATEFDSYKNDYKECQEYEAKGKGYESVVRDYQDFVLSKLKGLVSSITLDFRIALSNPKL